MTARRKRQGAGGTVRQVIVDGLRTRVEVRGEGPPLLLIMGLWGEVAAWDPVIERLGGFQTVAFDAPGIGGTELPAVPRSLPALAQFAAKVLDAVGVPRAHVLGVSFGGLVAQQLAVRAPARVRRLVLVSTSSGLPHVPGDPSALIRLLNPWALAAPDLGAVFGGRIRRDPQLLAGLGLRPPAGLPTYFNRLAGLAGWWGPAWSIRHPTLVVTGDDDPIVPPANSRMLAACLPDARLHIVPGGGHLVLFDSPDEVAPVVAGFLREGSQPSVGTLVS
jgi:pimeloyl-ACP methyl ester carboxylesterase